MGLDPDKPPCECAQALASLYGFLDGELKDIELADIQTHIRNCMSCCEAFEFEAGLRVLIASKCREPLPGHLIERIRLSIRSAHVGDS